MTASRPCPFCGKQRIVADTLNYTSGKPAKFRARCRDCLVSTGFYDTEDGAWAAWNRRETEEISLLINENAFVWKSRMYYRSPETGYCAAQKEFRGKMARITENAFRAAYAECEKIPGEGK